VHLAFHIGFEECAYYNYNKTTSNCRWFLGRSCEVRLAELVSVYFIRTLYADLKMNILK
jgi:hypothetical protein